MNNVKLRFHFARNPEPPTLLQKHDHQVISWAVVSTGLLLHPQSQRVQMDRLRDVSQNSQSNCLNLSLLVNY